MLSILIPVKDFCCCTLIEELHRQGEALGAPFEILVGEDGTSAASLCLNSIADTLPHCRRIVKEENIGRARIRNLLAMEAQYPGLIFIDCDAVVERDSFLAAYAHALEGHDVACGGMYHASELPHEGCSLRYRYEKKADRKRSAAIRSKAPYDRFTTFSFAIKREVFISILFDSSITRYGYEDALFGKELEKRGISILHIDNPLLHSGLEENAVFLTKTEQALETLAGIAGKIGDTPLLAAARRLGEWHIEGVFFSLWKCCRNLLKKNLLGRRPSLWVFNVYKLGYYISIQRKAKG